MVRVNLTVINREYFDSEQNLARSPEGSSVAVGSGLCPRPAFEAAIFV